MAKKSLLELFKEHQFAKGKFTKSGSHKEDFFGNGLTRDLPTCYFHLLLQGKPEALKQGCLNCAQGCGMRPHGWSTSWRWKLEAS